MNGSLVRNDTGVSEKTTSVFIEAMNTFEVFQGMFTGSWFTSSNEDPAVISGGFDTNNGKAIF